MFLFHKLRHIEQSTGLFSDPWSRLQESCIFFHNKAKLILFIVCHLSYILSTRFTVCGPSNFAMQEKRLQKYFVLNLYLRMAWHGLETPHFVSWWSAKTHVSFCTIWAKSWCYIWSYFWNNHEKTGGPPYYQISHNLLNWLITSWENHFYALPTLTNNFEGYYKELVLALHHSLPI